METVLSKEGFVLTSSVMQWAIESNYIDSMKLEEIIEPELKEIELASARALVRARFLKEAGMPEGEQYYIGIAEGLIAALKFLDCRRDLHSKFPVDEWKFIEGVSQ
jgi:hypothetical protein